MGYRACREHILLKKSFLSSWLSAMHYRECYLQGYNGHQRQSYQSYFLQDWYLQGYQCYYGLVAA